MDTKTLAIFVDCFRRRSFATVARERLVDPSTVTRAIATLESELSVRLFQRTTRTIEPTEAGRIYFEQVEPLLQELKRAESFVKEALTKPSGLLRISAPVSFAEMQITPHLPEFSRRYPDITFDYLLTDDDLDLVSHRIDVAIRVGPLEDSRLIATKLLPMESCVVASAQYLQRHGPPKTPADLSQHACLVLSYRGFDPKSWTFACRQTEEDSRVTIRSTLKTSNAMALKQTALAGMGVGLLATWMIKKELANGTLINLFPDCCVSSALSDAAAWALYPSRDYLPLKTRVFLDFIKAKLAP